MPSRYASGKPDRRAFLKSTSALAALGAADALSLTGCVPKKPVATAATAPALPFYDTIGPIIPIRADLDRIFRITVCLRPFRAAGPRLDTEKITGAASTPDKLLIHNYGHGGSGWSLSWGSAKLAVTNALTLAPNAEGRREIAVIGCGALGLTAAITAQRAGARVTIYCRERPPEVRSARATGSWTPDSRIALATAAAPSFGDTWETMARTSWAMYQSFLGMPGTPVEYADRYALRDETSAEIDARRAAAPPEPHSFAHYNSRIRDIMPDSMALPPGSTPFPTKFVRRSTTLTFNVADYSRQLYNDFLIAGGRIEAADFHTPADLATLPQPCIINCTGYGARALFSDDSIIPVRGQIAWLIPQEGVSYGIGYRDLNIIARRDGIVLQSNPHGDETGWNNTDETPDHAEAEASLRTLQDLYARMAPKH